MSPAIRSQQKCTYFTYCIENWGGEQKWACSYRTFLYGTNFYGENLDLTKTCISFKS